MIKGLGCGLLVNYSNSTALKACDTEEGWEIQSCRQFVTAAAVCFDGPLAVVHGNCSPAVFGAPHVRLL